MLTPPSSPFLLIPIDTLLIIQYSSIEPSYDYRCAKCNKKFTAILSIGEHDAGKVKCPKCGYRKLEQLVTAFQVKTSSKS
jgi:putative FmdB family regulatory protein